jgi:hypothetical protein
MTAGNDTAVFPRRVAYISHADTRDCARLISPEGGEDAEHAKCRGAGRSCASGCCAQADWPAGSSAFSTRPSGPVRTCRGIGQRGATGSSGPARPQAAGRRADVNCGPSRLDLAMYWAEDLAPPPPGAGYDFGMPRLTLRELVLIARRDLARARAAVLAPLLAELAEPDTWTRLRLVLEAPGVLRSQRERRPPLATCLDHVTASPRTGPPAGPMRIASRPEALLISP